MKQMEDVKQGRFFYFDLLRVIACLCVIMIHSSLEFVTNDFGSFDFWVGNVLNSIARIGVPIFIMISGALFLDEKYEYTSSKMVSHIKRIIVFFLFWSLCYSLFYNLLIPVVKHEDISVNSLLESFLLGHFHLWFCFMIVGLYLIVPLLRLWVKKENVTQIRYFMLLAVGLSMFIPRLLDFCGKLFPVLAPFEGIIDNLKLSYVSGYTVYFVLGWYLNNFEIKHKKALIILGICSIFVSIIGTGILSINLNEAHQTYSNLSAHVLVQAAMVFCLTKEKYKENVPQNSRILGCVSFVSKHSLGIYAIHVVIVDIVMSLFEQIGVSSSIICIPITFALAFVISLFGSAIIKKIPILKKVV